MRQGRKMKKMKRSVVNIPNTVGPWTPKKVKKYIETFTCINQLKPCPFNLFGKKEML
jgi:isopropylmalate/homocitrate/citramalate synthase